MIITLVIYVIAIILGMIAMLLPDWRVMPQPVYDTITFLVDKLIALDSIFLVFSIFLGVFIIFLKFLTYFALYKITIKVVNYLRGTGSGLD